MTKDEEAVLEKMRFLLAKEFGVSVVDHYVTLRFDENIVSMVVYNIQEWTGDECYMCGCNKKIARLSPATVEITHVNGNKTIRNVKTCADCWCPK